MIIYSDDPATRYMQGGCSTPEVLDTACAAFLKMKTETTNQKIGCIAGCTIVGASAGLILGGLAGGHPLEGMAIVAGVGLTIGIAKVVIDACSRNAQKNRN